MSLAQLRELRAAGGGLVEAAPLPMIASGDMSPARPEAAAAEPGDGEPGDSASCHGTLPSLSSLLYPPPTHTP
jgi:hypothetical protein